MLRLINCLGTQHDGWLVVLAAAVCFLTSLGAANLLQRARAAASTRVIWVVIAGILTGCGVWATHFIAMLAYSPGFPVHYDLKITFASLFAAIVITTAGFAVALFGHVRWGGVIGGALVGVGIACMHYMGMASLRIPAEIIWLPGAVVVSVLLSVLFGAAALRVAERGETKFDVAATAVLLTLAIVLHHFVGMSAIELIGRSAPDADAGGQMSPVALSVAIAACTAALIAAGLVGAILDRHNRRLTCERNLQLDAALNNMGQGLCMFGPDGRLQLWNARYTEMYRIPPGMLQAGCTPQDMFEVREGAGSGFRNADDAISRLKVALSEREPMTRLTELQDGRTISVSYQPMPNGGWVATHEDITERRENEARIAYLALHDPVTGLPNRAAFNTHIAEVLGRAEAQYASFAVVRIDIDHFKEINDVFGQCAGDAALSSLAQAIKDACHCGFLARPGGDEFSIITDPGPAPHTADDICGQLAGILDRECLINGQIIHIGCTVGVSIYPQDGADVETLIANADVALYRAKSEERGTIRFFEAEMDQQLREKRALQRELAAAIERNQFELYFQPQATTEGAIVGFEALIRWHHPERGMVPPGVFIPLAEDTGLIGAIDLWVLREACREAATWRNPLSIAVNLSPLDFRRSDVAAIVLSTLLETGLNPYRLEIEITEGVLIEDFARATSMLRQIKNLGVRIAMDDFGTGYSSLSYLQAFPFDKIKIDQTFIARLETNMESAVIVQAIVGLGCALRLPIIAEGVETPGQLAFLAKEGCDEVQGYLIGRPQPIAHYRDVVDGTSGAVEPIALAG